jgi:hypothetical protein
VLCYGVTSDYIIHMEVYSFLFKDHVIFVLASHGQSDSEVRYTGLQKQFGNYVVDYALEEWHLLGCYTMWLL